MSEEKIHPFVDFAARMKKIGGVRFEGKDMILADQGAKRFAVGIHDTKPLLCWHEDDDEAFKSISWTAAAIAYDLRGRDWIALSTTDARIRDAASFNRVAIRLFIPIFTNRMNEWKRYMPDEIYLGKLEVKNGDPYCTDPHPLRLPLKLLSK